MPACDEGTIESPPLASSAFVLSSYVSWTSYTVGKGCEAEDLVSLPLWGRRSPGLLFPGCCSERGACHKLPSPFCSIFIFTLCSLQSIGGAGFWHLRYQLVPPLWGEGAERINEWAPFDSLPECLRLRGGQAWRSRPAGLAGGSVASTLLLLAPGPWHLGQFPSACMVHDFSSLQRLSLETCQSIV